MVGDAGQRAIWWIDQDRLAGSHNPTDGELRSLRRTGFSALICLLNLQDEATGYSPERAVAAGYAFSQSGVYQAREGMFAEVEGLATSPVDAPREVRAREADEAKSWYRTITVDAFG